MKWPDAQRYAMLWTAPLCDLVRRLHRSLLECCRNPRDIVAIYNTGLFTHRLLVNSLVGVILRRDWCDLADIQPILRAHSKYTPLFSARYFNNRIKLSMFFAGISYKGRGG